MNYLSKYARLCTLQNYTLFRKDMYSCMRETGGKMNKYVFISNSTKPSQNELESLEDVKLSNFNRPCLEVAFDMGFEVILGVNRKYPEKLRCKEIPIKFYDSHTYRSITALKDNYEAYKNLCNLLKEGEVEVIHCNTPVGGFIGRICGKKYKVRKIIYTAHGFHFYKGASLFNNTILKWAEYLMAHWTDVIITMNEEDYRAAKKMKLRNGGHVYKVHGVGINLKEYNSKNVNHVTLRQSLDLNGDDFVCIAMGDLVKRKNYGIAIKAIAGCQNEKIHYLICGEGPEKEYLINLSKQLGVEKQIHFLGYRKDVKELLTISDCFLFTSLQEGLPRSTMEAMACGLPCIVSDIRGNIDLIDDRKGGFLIGMNNDLEFSHRIDELSKNQSTCRSMANYNLKKISNFDSKIVTNEIENIYLNELIIKNTESD